MTKIRLNSETLQGWLDRQNLSQRRFGREHHMSSAFISQIMTGQRHVGPNVRRKLQDATGLSFDELFRIESGRPELSQVEK